MRIRSHGDGQGHRITRSRVLQGNRRWSNRVTPDSQRALHTARQPNFAGKYVSLGGGRLAAEGLVALMRLSRR